MLVSDKPFEILLDVDVINKNPIYHVGYVICTGLYSYKAMMMLNYVLMTVHNKIHNKFNKEGHLQILPQMYSFTLGANNTVGSLSFFRCTTYNKYGEIVIPLRAPEITYSGQTEADVCIKLFNHYFVRFMDEFLKSDRFVNECGEAMKMTLTKQDFFNLFNVLFNNERDVDLIGAPLNPFEEHDFAKAVGKCSSVNLKFYDNQISKGNRFKSKKNAKSIYDKLYKVVSAVDNMKKMHDGLI